MLIHMNVKSYNNLLVLIVLLIQNKLKLSPSITADPVNVKLITSSMRDGARPSTEMEFCLQNLLRCCQLWCRLSWGRRAGWSGTSNAPSALLCVSPPGVKLSFPMNVCIGFFSLLQRTNVVLFRACRLVNNKKKKSLDLFWTCEAGHDSFLLVIKVPCDNKISFRREQCVWTLRDHWL